MKSCYVVMKCYPNATGENDTEVKLEALTENLHLAEQAIANYYTQEFGEAGEQLVCLVWKNWSVREYHMRSHYKEVKDATFFRVWEQEIIDDAALL